MMHAPLVPFRTMFIALAVAASMLIACGDNRPAEQPRGRDTASVNTDTARRAVVADSLSGKQARKNPIDSAMLAPPPPLAGAPAALAADTIPLHAPNGEPARYGIKSGRVVQRFTGNSRGERRIVFDDYGMKERREEVS